MCRSNSRLAPSAGCRPTLRCRSPSGRRAASAESRFSQNRGRRRRCSSRRRPGAAARPIRGGCRRCRRPPGPSSHLCPSAARKSIGVCRTSSGNTPRPWMASTKNSTPRSRHSVADGVQVVAKAAGVFDVAEADQRACGRRWRARRSSSRAGRRGSATGRTSTPRPAQVQPRIDVGGILLRRGDDVVAGLPGEALGDDADAFAGVLDEGDVERIGVEEPAGSCALPRPWSRRAIIYVAVFGQVGGPFDARRAGFLARRFDRRRRGGTCRGRSGWEPTS